MESKIYTEKDLNNFVDISPNGVLIIDETQKILKCNDIANIIFGYKNPNTLKNKNLNIIIPENYKKAHDYYIKCYFKNPYKRIGRIFNGLKADNTLIPIEVSLTYIIVNDIPYVLSIIREVREKTQMEYFNIILDSVVDGIILSDKEGKIQILNNQILNIFGYKREELLLQPVEILIPEKYKKDHVILRNNFMKNFDNIDENMLTRYCEGKKKNNTIIFLQISLSKVTIDQQPAILLIIRDVTQKKLFEEELIRTKEEAVNAAKSKTDFLSNMSHEIRTPLNGIIGSIELFDLSGLNNEQLETIETLKSCADSLTIIINDILDFSKILNNKMLIRPFTDNLIKIKNEISNMTKILLKDKKLHIYEEFKNITNTDHIYIYLDFQRFKQILLNLISNAIKFTQEGGSIYITYEIFFDKKEIIFQIKDTGIGISETKRHLLFKMFSRVHDGIFQGTGLGLVISKNLTELMGGTLNYTSVLHKGTIFTVKIPYKELFTKEDIDDKNKQNLVKLNELNELNILVVEDNIINMKIVLKMLQKLKILNISQASNGLEALNLIKNNTFDIILMDVHMPELNGLETTKKIRDFNIQIPIIAMTASTFDNEIKQCMDSGMTDKLLKPFTLLDLKKILTKWKIN